MRRIISFALFGLLLSTEPAFPQTPHFVRPHGTVFVHGSHFRSHHRRIHRHHYWFDPFRFSIIDFAPPSPSESSVPLAPTYYFYRNESSTIHPRLVFKDHMTYTVEDYWRVSDQLHFITSEEGGTKSIPRTVPFSDLDVDATTDALTAQGFKFRVRDEPIEQWLQHHAQDAPRSSSNTPRGKAAARRHSRAR
jgi:hypothetical protein